MDLLALVAVDQVDPADFLAQTQGHPFLAHQMDQGVDDFFVHEGQDAQALVDHGDAHAQGREDGRVFDADHPGADHGQAFGQGVEFQDIVRSENVLAVEGDVVVARGRRADGDGDLVGRDFGRRPAAAGDQRNAMRVDERCLRIDDLDVVAQHLVTRDVDADLAHMISASQQIGHGDFLLHLVGRAVDAAFVVAGKMHGRGTKRLGRNGAGVQAYPADHGLAFGQRHPLAQLGRLHRRALARRARADDEQVIVVTAHCSPKEDVDGAQVSWQEPLKSIGFRAPRARGWAVRYLIAVHNSARPEQNSMTSITYSKVFRLRCAITCLPR